MRILLCHNYYQQPGGEDRCFEDEAALLEGRGHQVFRYEKNNDHIRGWRSVTAAGTAIWNRKTYAEVRALVRKHHIDILHGTNVFPVISPSIYYAASAEGIPVVQALQNYRLFCANAYFLRDGKVCEKCLGKRVAIPAIRHGCYRDSYLGSAAVVAMQAFHNALGSWQTKIDQYIVPTEFAKRKFVEGGLPGEKISVKPNFVDPDPGIGDGSGDYALFVGRLSEEKGLGNLLTAWENPKCNLPLHVVGDGPMLEMVKRAAEQNKKVHYCGFKSPAEVFEKMKLARFVVVPSLWYEGLPRTIVESFSVGTPVLATNLGPLAEVVHPDAGGLRFDYGSVESLTEQAGFLCNQPAEATRMRSLARQEFETRFSPEANYRSLMQIYAEAWKGRDPQRAMKFLSGLDKQVPVETNAGST